MLLSPLRYINPISGNRGGSAITPFTPAEFSPTLWLEDEAQYMTFSSGSLVERWNDVRGNGVYVENLSPATQPTHNGDGLGVSFVNKELVSNTNLDNIGEVFVVFQPNNDNGGFFYSNTLNDNKVLRLRHQTDFFRSYWSDGVSSNLILSGTTDATLQNVSNLYHFHVDLGMYSNRVRGSFDGANFSRTSRNPISYTPKIGAANVSGQTNGIIKAVICCRSLNTDERLQMEDYLASKYSLTINARPTEYLNMIAIMGDSTARGNGSSTNLPIEYQGVQANVNIWNTGNHSIETYQTTGIGQNNVQPYAANTYASLTDSVGKNYIDRIGGNIHLLKYGVGSSTLGGNWNEQATSLMDASMGISNRYEYDTEVNLNKYLRVKALVVCLGDNDGANLTYSNDFATNMNAFLNRMNQLLPNTPQKYFIRRPIDTNPTTYISTVRSEIDGLSGVTVMDIDDLTTSDGIHLDEVSDVTLGERISDLI